MTIGLCYVIITLLWEIYTLSVSLLDEPCVNKYVKKPCELKIQIFLQAEICKEGSFNGVKTWVKTWRIIQPVIIPLFCHSQVGMPFFVVWTKFS